MSTPPRRRPPERAAGRTCGRRLAADAAAVHGDPRGLGAERRRARPARRTGLGVDRPGGRRHPVRPASAGELVAAKVTRRPADRPGHVPHPRRPAAGVPHPAGLVRRRGGVHGADRHPGAGSACRSGWATGGSGASPPSCTASGRPGPGESAMSATWRTSRCGPAPNSAPASCWSIRCTRPNRPAPMEPSPYLPTTRRFQNPLYLRVERIPEYADLDAAARRRWRVARGARTISTRSTGSTATSPGRRSAGAAAGVCGAAVRRP